MRNGVCQLLINVRIVGIIEVVRIVHGLILQKEYVMEFKDMGNEELLEYYAVNFYNLQLGKDVGTDWENMKKEILVRMEKDVYKTAILSLSQSVKRMQIEPNRDMVGLFFHSILGQIDILSVCEVISDSERRFWESLVYKAYGFE